MTVIIETAVMQDSYVQVIMIITCSVSLIRLRRCCERHAQGDVVVLH